MKIALAQQNYHIGNFESNTNKIIEGIQWVKQQGADLVVFSELSVWHKELNILYVAQL